MGTISNTSLITGGAGFIGSHLCETLLEQGHTVHCVDNLLLGKEDHIAHLVSHPNFHFKRLDLLDLDTLTQFFDTVKVDTIFHLAANSDIQKGSQFLDTDLSHTFLTTFNLIKMARQYHCKEFVFASSSAVYGNSDTPLSESESPFLPISFYGSAKLASEAYLHALLEHTDMSAWIVRFPNVVGERLTHGVIYDFINKLNKTPKTLAILGNGKQAKPYLYVNDLINAILLIWRSLHDRWNVINVGVESTTTVDTIADEVIQALGLNQVSKQYTGSDKGWPGDVPHFTYDLTKIHQLGWKANYSSTEAITLSIKKEIEWRNRIQLTP